MSQVDPTWVRPEAGWTCPECGFEFDTTDPREAPEAFRAFGKRYQAPLTRGLRDEDLTALLRLRPAPDAWSALEYACHVRDAFGVCDHRIAKTLAEDRPIFQAMDRDAAVVRFAYNEQDPVVVGAELAEAAEKLAQRVEAVPDDGWERVGVRDTGYEMSVAWIARNALHEASHHLLDIGRTLRAARGR